MSGAGLKGACLCKGRGGGDEKSSFYRTFQGGGGKAAALSLGGSFVKEMDAASGAQRKRKGGGGVRRTGTGFDLRNDNILQKSIYFFYKLHILRTVYQALREKLQKLKRLKS